MPKRRKLDELDRRVGEVPPDEEGSPEVGTLIFENPEQAKGYTSVSNFILFDARLTPAARAAYSILLAYAWQEDHSFPGQARLARDLGVSDRMVRHYLAELVDQDYIKVVRRGLGKTNIYIITDVSRIIRIAESKLKKESCDNHDNNSHPDRKPISDQERKPISTPKRKPVSYNEDSVKEDVLIKDTELTNSKDIPSDPPGENAQNPNPALRAGAHASANAEGKREGPWSDDIAKILEDLTKYELHDLDDPINIYRNPKRGMKLWRKSELEEKDFIELLYEAKKITLGQSGNIRKTANNSRSVKNRAPYFFGVLENLLAEKKREKLEEMRREVLARTQGGMVKGMSS
jgi:hypothetical protein